MTSWLDNSADKAKFLSHVARKVLDIPIGQPVEAPMLRDEVVLKARDLVGANWAALSSVDTAILTFDVWWDKHSSDFYLSLVGDINMITVSASVRAGNTDLTVGLRLVPNDDLIHEQISYAVKACNLLLEKQALSIGVKVSRSAAAGSGAAARPQSSASTIKFQAESIMLTHDGKNLRAKVLGAQFSQFGVPLYPEHAQQFGLELDKMPLGVHVWKHQVIAELGHDNKPKRIINLKAD